MENYCLPRFLRLMLLCLFLQAGVVLHSQNIRFERIPNELGLSQNFISALCFDKDGFLWVGTKDGLNRFDGYRFKVYQHDPFDSTSLSSNYIKTILEDSQGRLWAGTTEGLNLFNREDESFQRLGAPEKPFHPEQAITENFDGLPHGDINCILEDKLGNIWLGTMLGGLAKLEMPAGSRDLEQAKITVFSSTGSENSLWEHSVTSMALDETGALWVHAYGKITVIKGSSTGGPYRIQRLNWADFDPQWKNYSQDDFWYTENGKKQVDHRFLQVLQGRDGAVWVMSAGGFGKWLPSGPRFALYGLDINLKDYPVLPLAGAAGRSLFDHNGRLWATGGWSVVLYDTLSHKILVRNHLQDRADIGLPPGAGARSLLEGPNGNMWLGTNGNGLFKYTPGIQKFDGQNGTLLWKGNSVRTICETSDGIIWLGLTNLRLLRYDRKSGIATPLVLDKSRWLRTYDDELDYVYAIAEAPDGNLWIGAEQGLFRFRMNGSELADWDFYEIREMKAKGLLSTIRDIHIDGQGQIWLLTPFEFGRFDPETGSFDGHDYLSLLGGERLSDAYPCIYQQRNGIFWLGTNWGLLRFDPKNNSFSHWANSPDKPESLSHNLIKCIHPDPRSPEQVLWIGTGGGGLNRFNLETGRFTHYKKQDGLPDNVVYGILSDAEGYLWLSTNQGLSRFNPHDGTFKNYTTANGLQDNEFNSAAYFKAPDGELFFGGINGFNAFHPEAVKDNHFVPNVKITGFKVANQPVDFRTDGSPLHKPITETETIVLSWQDKVFSFEFASLDLTRPEQNQYAYQMEGFHDDWQYIGTERTATFTNLNPGEYTFRVKATNYDGVWNEQGASLTVIILPPWWRTWWAYCCYAILLATLILGLYRFQLNRQLERAESERLKEMDTIKTRLYTNITHEFRTPLTVILGLTEQLSEDSEHWAIGAEIKHKLKSGFSLIHRNSNNLLRLINQLLDLSKLNSGAMKLNPVRSNIINYLQYLTESFYSVAHERGIRLTFYSEAQGLEMDYDEEKIQNIVYNLLSNALKFTGKGGKAVLHVNQTQRQEQPFLVLKVQDTGAGIPKGQLEHIFGRFYQADSSHTRKGEGTGIGLALTKELAELMGGSIGVESTPGVGTTFTVLLPVKREEGTPLAKTPPAITGIRSSVPGAGPDVQLPEAVDEESLAGAGAGNDKPSLLLIEDNADVTTYITGLLAAEYNIITAPDGQAGIEKAFEEVPDIIISDVMMPAKDGYEVCVTLKSDERTSHIPIILLTAKAAEADRITGLKQGADAWLMKPFNKEELFVRLEKLVELRRNLQARYGSNLPGIFTPLPSSTEPNLEDLFLQKIRQVVEDRIDDHTLSIQALCQAVNLSHTQVYRKLKALTGLTPSQYIRKVRLQKAAVMLKTAQKNISEIAYEVGFSDPNYFSRAFNQEFGLTPSEMRGQ
ncbi:MAG: helix-turn-helix domain-containing protein [Lewinellaceae bacterium]|nr:helix-turn-helix domain-containing protein [Lewinellaceae bacterium]